MSVVSVNTTQDQKQELEQELEKPSRPTDVKRKSREGIAPSPHPAYSKDDADVDDDDGADEEEEEEEEDDDDDNEGESSTRPGHPHLDMSQKEDEADEIVGVSIGRAQDRIKARCTPIEEKNFILRWDLRGRYGTGTDDAAPTNEGGAGLFLSEVTGELESLEGEKDEGEPYPGHARTRTASSENEVGKKPPKDGREGRGWKRAPRSGLTRSILKSRSRDSSPNFSSLKKFLPGPLLAGPRSRSLSLKLPRPLPICSDRDRKRSPDKSRRRFSWMSGSNGSVDKRDRSRSSPRTAKGFDSRVRRSSTGAGSGTGHSLRKSTSDRSLYLTSSSASSSSSLEDADRYENVHSQVNIRFKAIKDTLHDSSRGLLTMPSIPVHLPDFRFGDNNNQNGQSEDVDSREAHNGGNGPRQAPSDNMYPILSEAMASLTGDVVIMGGYRGSVLRSAKPPHRQLWIPVKTGLNLRKVDLEVGLNPEDEERMEETVIPGEVLSHVGPVDVCRKLIKKLQKCENSVNGDLRVWEYGYDWRLSPRLLADRLVAYLEGLPCNAPDVPPEKRGAYVIAHSLGGLIARHAVNQRPDLFAGVLYAGTPQHCVNILGPLRCGEDVLLNSRVLTAQVSFSFRTSFALLPESGRCFIDKRTKERYILDFFDAKTWDEYRLSPVINPPLPPLTPKHTIGNLPLIGKRFTNVRDVSPEGSGSDSAGSGTKEEETTSARPHEHADGHRYSRTLNQDQVAGALNPDAHGMIGPSTGAPRIPPTSKAATTSTIPPPEAMKYLERTLSEVLQFKKELAFNPAHQSENRYPPFAVLYGKSIPTVYGARVWSREQIKHHDAYDDLAFAAGDGVVLASASMLPPKYRIIKGGLVKSERGHVSLLGDLDGVGHCLSALARGRKEGVGLGSTFSPTSASPSTEE